MKCPVHYIKLTKATNNGEETIKEAEGTMIDIIKYALKDKVFIESFINEENCSSEEKFIADNLRKETRMV